METQVPMLSYIYINCSKCHHCALFNLCCELGLIMFQFLLSRHDVLFPSLGFEFHLKLLAHENDN